MKHIRKFFRYDVVLSATFAALAFSALWHVSTLAAWIAAAPLVPLLRRVLRQVAPPFWLPVPMLILFGGAGYVVFIELLGMDSLPLALLPLGCALGAVASVGYVVNGHPVPAR